ncbi:hypothetical protein LL998_33930 (plasmid) [Burkholderia ambifaria]|uniref:hypothetical protein n=1 Tax=Burkholderia ambifaria TaxID=152480 RepID=UPI001E4ED864|nr:hypothetical protein [Burkholderia ambifaria]UEP39742.1 hypothetical protein LL998_33930 [Burkholderia ambifaria]
MDYATHYADLVYLVNGDPAVCRYRFFLVDTDPKQVIVQIDNHRGPKNVLVTDYRARDTILNRIADRELMGIPFDMLCVALTNDGTHHILFVEPDLEDYVHRGFPYERSSEPAARGRHVERISIDSRNLVIGRARILTAHATPSPAAADLASVLDRPVAG